MLLIARAAMRLADLIPIFIELKVRIVFVADRECPASPIGSPPSLFRVEFLATKPLHEFLGIG